MTTTERRLEITEGDGFATLSGVDIAAAAAIGRLRIGSVTPLADGEWRVTNIRKVGAVKIDGFELRVNPKIQIDRLFYLLSRGRHWGEWFGTDVDLSNVGDLYSAIAEVFGRWGERILRGGVLKKYRELRAAEPFIRGRWLATEQINRRHGMQLPAELQYDEFTVDIPENQILRAATVRLLSMGGLPDLARARLHRIDRQLGTVAPIARGALIPDIAFDRRNERYRPVLSLARLILANSSLEHHSGATQASGFLLNLSTVFEDYVEAEVTRHARPFGGEILAQHVSRLDGDGQVLIKPDLLWRVDGRVRAVFDAKYKVIHSDTYPNADIYQMLAYCIRHGVSEGHLVYADGDPLPTEIAIRQEGKEEPVVRVYAHALDLSRSPDSIDAQMRKIVGRALRWAPTELDRAKAVRQ